MKITLAKIIICFGVFSLTGCFGNWQDDDGGSGSSQYQPLYEPILMPRLEFENSTELLPARTIINSGKIYVKDNFLFISEVHEGFHIINNTHPENPKNIAFLKVIGSADMSIKNNSIYMDNASDLIAVKFTDAFDAVQITKRIPEIFPNPLSISPDYYQNYYEEGYVVIGWELIE